MSSERAFGRRAALGAALGLGGCGFTPLYAPVATGSDGVSRSMRSELGAVRIGVIPERNGQILRRALQRRFEGVDGGGVAAKYELQVNLAFGVEILGYQTDGTITRARYTATGNWVLRTIGVPPQELARASPRTIDAFDVPTNQYFAADASRESMERRILEELGDQIFRGVTVELRRRMQAGPAA